MQTCFQSWVGPRYLSKPAVIPPPLFLQKIIHVLQLICTLPMYTYTPNAYNLCGQQPQLAQLPFKVLPFILKQWPLWVWSQAHLSFFTNNWQVLTKDSWMLSAVTGYKIAFFYPQAQVACLVFWTNVDKGAFTSCRSSVSFGERGWFRPEEADKKHSAKKAAVVLCESFICSTSW